MKLWHAIALTIAPALILYGMSQRSPAQSGWVEPYVYDLAHEVLPTECTSRGCNLTPALTRAMSACEGELAGTSGNRAFTGCTFLIPAGDHSITETITACRGHQFRGRGGFARRAATSIAVPDVTAFHARGYGDCGDTSGGRFTIEGLGLVYPSGPKAVPVVAILAESQVRVEDVWITYPSVGIHITAGTDRTPASNANTALLFAVKTEYTRHAGVQFNGYDSNAHSVLAGNFGTACMATGEEMAGLEAQFGACGAYVDDSFLGAHAIALHTSAAAAYPDIVIEGGSNHGVCVGCYQEGPTPGHIDAQAILLGGKNVTPTGNGFYLRGRVANGLTIRNDQDPANVVELRLGRATNVGGAFYGLHHGTNNWPLRMKWAPTLNGGSYLEDIANASTGRVRSIRGTRDGSPPPGGDTDALGRTKHWDVEDILP